MHAVFRSAWILLRWLVLRLAPGCWPHRCGRVLGLTVAWNTMIPTVVLDCKAFFGYLGSADWWCRSVWNCPTQSEPAYCQQPAASHAWLCANWRQWAHYGRDCRIALKALDVDQNGLDEMDIRILSTIIEKFKGGPWDFLPSPPPAATAETIEEVYEPFLIQEGFRANVTR